MAEIGCATWKTLSFPFSNPSQPRIPERWRNLEVEPLRPETSSPGLNWPSKPRMTILQKKKNLLLMPIHHLCVNDGTFMREEGGAVVVVEGRLSIADNNTGKPCKDRLTSRRRLRW